MPEGEPTNTAKPLPSIGSYRLLQSLGSGGMSSVFRAVHIETGHEVAVKVLPRALAKNATLLQRFLREAKSAESLEHPNIVSIYDRGVDQGRNYLVLEYVEGGDLHDRVKAQGPLGIAEAVGVVTAVARGLQFAAGRGLIHRDIKPANILMTPDGKVKIIDLGLALQAEDEDERVTREGTTVGTVDFMAPEQARDSRATSERSDIYSLGCTFYYLLTGAPPFPGGDVADKLSRHCTKPAPDPRELRPEIPEALAQLVRRMMAKRPENRFRDYQQLLDSLETVPTGAASASEGTLDAVFDDDDAPEQAPVSEPLYAVIDEDEEDETSDTGAALRLLEPDPASILPHRAKEREFTPSLADISLADLAPLTDDVPREPTRRNESSQILTRRAAQSKTEPDSPAEALVDDEDSVEMLEGGTQLAGSRRFDDASRKWVMRCALIGVCVVLLIIGAHQLIRSAATEAPIEVDQNPAVAVSVPEEPDSPVQATVAHTRPRPPIVKRAIPKPKIDQAKPAPVPAWVEPADPVRETVTDTDFRADLESSFLPDWAKPAIPDHMVGKSITVRRLVDPKDASQRPSLRVLYDVVGGTVELADDGPFFENDLRISGESRLVRARAGYRPIVAVESPQLDVVRAQKAVFVLEGKSLVLEGLDLIVDVQELPLGQSALFLCRGSTLTLRNCTITVVNPKGQPFAIVRTAPAARPSRVRLDETMLRGTSTTPFDLGGGVSEVALQRSVIVGGSEPVIACTGPEPGNERRIHLVRSILCGRGPVFDTS
ncbi:MAG TPA: serine/threonine-protein kinase, partial [Acidimicrobiales bacterium]|nr:serine/threonine-protein kinase [Acidimicrobiales bacterium]